MSVSSVDWALRELHRVFDGYQSGATGAGIGLALVKQIADAHGAVEATSPPPGLDHGTRSTITFRLPGRTAG